MHPGDIRKKSTRVCRAPWPYAMAQFICSRIADNRDNPTPEMAHAYGLRLPLWLLTKPKFPRPLIKFLSFPFSVDFSYFSFLYSLVGSSYAQKLHGHVTLKIWVSYYTSTMPRWYFRAWYLLITNSPRLTICCDKPNSTCSKWLPWLLSLVSVHLSPFEVSRVINSLQKSVIGV